MTVEEVSETGVVVLLVRVSFLATLKQRLGVAILCTNVGVRIDVCADRVWVRELALVISLRIVRSVAERESFSCLTLFFKV